jgi:hypothetical protein
MPRDVLYKGLQEHEEDGCALLSFASKEADYFSTTAERLENTDNH